MGARVQGEVSPRPRRHRCRIFRMASATPALSRDNYTIEEFFNSLIAGQPALRVARVDKSRRGFVFQGCIAEFVRLSVSLHPLQSFSVEHEDRSLILAALEQLGLDSHANTSYPLGLKRALGLDRVAA